MQFSDLATVSLENAWCFSMSLCINPTCTQPDHPGNDNHRFCQTCGSELVLLGRYRVMRLISDKSGFGKLYEAYERSTPKILKVLKEAYGRDLKIVELFQQEAVVLGRLKHPGIPQIDEPGYFQFWPRQQSDPLHCIVMEKIDGPNLMEWMQQQGNHAISEKQALKWLRQLAEVLHLVHQQNYFHRDIKPQNIMLRSSGQLVLIDFGAAREMTQTYLARISGAGYVTRISSAGYTPPEQEKGQALPQSDFYAIGRTFVYLLTGQHLLDDGVYDALTTECRWRYQADHVSAPLADFLDRLMAYRPVDRPRNTQELLEALDEVEQKIRQPAIAPLVRDTRLQSPSAPQLHPLQWPKSWYWFGGAALLTMAIGVAGYSLWQWQTSFHRPAPVEQMIVSKRRLTGHTSFVNTLLFSPDGQFLISGGADKQIKIWNLTTGQAVRTLSGHKSFINSLAISPDGQTLASGGADKQINIWNLTTGQLVRSIPFTNYVNALAFSPDGSTLAGASADRTLRLWQVKTGQLLRTFKGHSSFVNALAISPDGKVMASASADKTVKLWDVATGQLLHTLTGHTSFVNAVVISPDGQTVASGSADQTIRIWDMTTGKARHTLQGHRNYVSSLAISADGQTLISGSADQTFQFWALATGKVQRTLADYDRHINYFAISPDWQTIATGSGAKTITVWQLQSSSPDR